MRLRKLTPVLIVDAIEPCLPFWVTRLGFERTVEVPHGQALGFVILVRDGVEVMLQTRASVATDIPAAVPAARGHATALYFEVEDLDAFEVALRGVDPVHPRRTTFYGSQELAVREPSGHVVVFAQPAAT
jgi:uncharacterized glyoxalase superfamily protein PhnB